MTELFFFKPIDKDESNPGISVFTVDDFGDFFWKNSRFAIRICNPLPTLDEAKISLPSMYEEPTNDTGR